MIALSAGMIILSLKTPKKKRTPLAMADD